ncbi:putative methyltransferase (TIGR04325 family) [Rhizobium leguminosarum]|uniref:Putative methyltransferase (TIGR04325 family) n=1 Tax=Rhizobium leguminosarum TaxID=384 RepID=A0A7Z0E5A3_RHILE|nr:hypothetical protein [Rhizobium leguminosarum]NYJ15159.1 putative methyltransferase (TIGR04325 family) [Rhizobium leguminosarum]
MSKQLIRAIVPMPVRAAVSEWRKREKVYWSWGRAAAAAGDYSSRDLTAFRVERSRHTLGSEELFVKPTPELLLAMDSSAGRYVDFGGSAGEMCAVLQRKFEAWSFAVVETTAMASASQVLRPSISFLDEMPDEFDVFYSSGTLQYLGKPEEMWREALSRTTRFAYLARNAFSKRKRITVQTSRLFDNGAGPVPEGFEDMPISYPHQTLSEVAVIKIADKAGFDLVTRVGDRNGGVTGTNGKVYGADMLFKRRR